MRTLTRHIVCILVALSSGPSAFAADRWEDALDALDLEEAALGFSPRGYWTRYPLPVERGIPYVLPAFDDLLADLSLIHI